MSEHDIQEDEQINTIANLRLDLLSIQGELHAYNTYIPSDETLDSLRKLYMKQFSTRINVLFQTLGIMLVLFIPIFITIHSSLEGVTYILYIIALLLFGLSYLTSLVGFLVPLDLSHTDNYAEVEAGNRYWNWIFIYIPLINLGNSLCCIVIIFIINQSELIIPWLLIISLGIIAIYTIIIACLVSQLNTAVPHPIRRFRIRGLARRIRYAGSEDINSFNINALQSELNRIRDLIRQLE
jgi:hypothetical protein